MRFEDERYVRLYTRDTVTWKLLPWQSKCLLGVIMRKLDRAGMLDLEGDGWEGLAAITDMPVELLDAGMPKLLEKGIFERHGDRLVMPRFIEAQDTGQSQAQRSRESRAKARDVARRSVTPRNEATQGETKRVETDTKRDSSKSTHPATDRDGTDTKRDDTDTKRVAPDTGTRVLDTARHSVPSVLCRTDSPLGPPRGASLALPQTQDTGPTAPPDPDLERTRAIADRAKAKLEADRAARRSNGG